ncbi:hypothetical protein CH375_10210 [Leptospira ellisii]|uniref:Uncharacterized protein n=1 Tax=Leptospira ellisii TaxID=2023197 RepID=A0A2N0BAK5_9LEPT|nr:hypothetical protein CH379_07125 [Leptospira ellisii]PKA04561.1 hypothetical protein CH375_10210 [Leptospira ellisii]
MSLRRPAAPPPEFGWWRRVRGRSPGSFSYHGIAVFAIENLFGFFCRNSYMRKISSRAPAV